MRTDEKNFVRVVRLVELALGIKCPGVDYSKLCSSSTPDDLGLLSVAKFAEPAVASVLTAAADAMPAVISQLGLSDLHLRRALSGLDNTGIPEGHGAGRGHLGAYGQVSGGHKRSEDEQQDVPHGSSVERFAARRKAHRRGLSAKLNKGVQRQCLTTS